MDDRPLMWAKEYVESLHQNSRAALLFGKNNVLVQPVSRGGEKNPLNNLSMWEGLLLFACVHGEIRLRLRRPFLAER